MREHNESQPSDDEEASPEPAEMMALLTEQQRSVDQALLAPVPWLYGTWGVAWLVGFFVLWSAWDGGNPWFRMDGRVAGVIFAVLIVGSIVASAIMGSRINRGVRGVSDFQGTVYGISWSLCGFSFFAFGAGLAFNGASPELISVYFPSAYALMAGTLYIGAAALWRDKTQLVIGIVLLVLASAAPFAGQPTNNIIMSLGGGATFLVGAAVASAQLRRTR